MEKYFYDRNTKYYIENKYMSSIFRFMNSVYITEYIIIFHFMENWIKIVRNQAGILFHFET